MAHQARLLFVVTEWLHERPRARFRVLIGMVSARQTLSPGLTHLVRRPRAPQRRPGQHAD